MRRIWSIVICLFLTIPVFAQQGKREHIEAVKVAFITQKLNLTSDEASKFWPVYREYQKELEGLLRQKREAAKAQKENPDKVLDNQFNFDERIIELRKKYRKEFGEVVSSQKVMQFFQAEREFREQLIRELKERKEKG